MKDLIDDLSEEEQDRLVNSLQTVERILNTDTDGWSTLLLRDHRPGDIGWMTYRHGAIYYKEYGWDETFEALVGDILVQFIKKHDPRRERIWIAEQDGRRVGSIMIVDAGNDAAKLRLLLVEPSARGRGVGRRLIDECIDYARRKGYKKIKLWTNNNLTAARHLYAQAGFRIVKETPHRSFGHDLVGEDWELKLTS